jgi:hypothetical protein
MSKARDEIEELPPQPDEDGNAIAIEVGSKLGTSKTPTLEDLMKKLDKLKAENKKLKAKGKTYSTCEDGDSEEEVSKKGRGRNKNDKPSYNTMSFNYNNMPNSTTYTSVPVGKAPSSPHRWT